MTNAGEVAWRATHRDRSEEDPRFRDMARESPELLDRSKFAALDRLSHLFRRRPRAWPTFVGLRQLGELQRVDLGVCDLVRAIPCRGRGRSPRRCTCSSST